LGETGHGFQHRIRDRSRPGQVHLIHEDHGIDGIGNGIQVAREGSGDIGRGGVPVLEVEPIEFLGRATGMMKEGFGVGEGVATGHAEESVEGDAGLGLQGAIEFPTFAIVAGDADRMDLADAEGDEIVQDGAGGPGLAADTDDVVDGETGLDGDLGAGGVDVEIAVETEVADDGEAEVGVTGGDGVESVRGHGKDPSGRVGNGDAG